MLRRLVDDVTLPGIAAVVLDEFHERSLEMDLVLGLLVRLRQTVRPDLRVIVMSATLAAEPVARLLGAGEGQPIAAAGAALHAAGCPIIHAEGRMFPVETRYLPHGDRRGLVEGVAETLPHALRATAGHVLVFLPGVGEIHRCEEAIRSVADRHGVHVVPLSGDMPPEAQDRALEDVGRRKVVLATNVAETSLTIPGVTAVIDSGVARQSRVLAATGLPRLELVPISKASADQRAGRAGRTEAGICWRLWDEASHQHRSAAEPPEALREDVTGPLLQLLAIGEAEDFPWLDTPPQESLERAGALLRQLGATAPDGSGRDRITPLGETLAKLPAHPRLARLLLAGSQRGVLHEASIAAAMLSERDPFRTPRSGGGPRDRQTIRTRSDIVDRVFALAAAPGSPVAFARQHESQAASAVDPALDPHPAAAHAVFRTAEQLARLIKTTLVHPGPDPGLALMRALLDAFPDRLARQRAGSQDRGTLVGGRGVRLKHSRVRGEPLFLAIDVQDAGGEAEVRLASAVERAWLDDEPLATANLQTTEDLLWHASRRQVEARLRTSWLGLVLDEAPASIRDAAAAAAILACEAANDLPRVLPAGDSDAGSLIARACWLSRVAPDLDLPLLDNQALAVMLPELCQGLRSLAELEKANWLVGLHAALGYDRVAEIESLAPTHIEVKGKRHRLTYEAGKPPILAVRIQEIFGVTETPRLAGGRFPVLLHLLGPNHRPQQVTDDLAGFWERTYPQVRKELRRRYPKHAWPENPLASS